MSPPDGYTQQLEELEKLAVQKVREAAQKNELLKVPKLRPILSFWRDSVGVEEVKQWVQSIIQKDDDLVNLLENFLSKNGKNYRPDPQSLAPYLEASEVIGQVRRLADDSDLTENQRIALKQFIKEYEMRERGENPNHPFP
jgi:predicted KAP-like P-loop ATPase